jgi:hypothetical protein
MLKRPLFSKKECLQAKENALQLMDLFSCLNICCKLGLVPSIFGLNPLAQLIHIIQYTKRDHCPYYCLHRHKHCGLEYCNDRVALTIETWKGCKGRVGLSFHWDVNGIEEMVGEKMVSSSFGGAQASDCRHLALGQVNPGCLLAKWGCRPQSADRWCWGCPRH